MDSPTKDEIRALRKVAHLTQEEAAAKIYSTRRTLQEWEAGNVKMHPGLWELLNLKVANIMSNIEGTNEGAVRQVHQIIEEARTGRKQLQVAVDKIAAHTQELLAVRKVNEEGKLPATAVVSAYILSTNKVMPGIEDMSKILLLARMLVAAQPPMIDVVDWLQHREHFVEAVKLMQAVYSQTIVGKQRLNPALWPQIPLPVRYWLTDMVYRYHKE